jgi:hypothetical protein
MEALGRAASIRPDAQRQSARMRAAATTSRISRISA